MAEYRHAVESGRTGRRVFADDEADALRKMRRLNQIHQEDRWYCIGLVNPAETRAQWYHARQGEAGNAALD